MISESLGEEDNPQEEADGYREKIGKLRCDEEAKTHLLKECDKLAKMPQGSHEATVVRNYLDKCLEIPFGTYTKDNMRLDRARKVLDKDHYGLDKVKDRIVESLAVLRRNPDFSGQILCLAGPPGVGKTSIVKSLAKAMNRKYVRVALGGVHDEAEIRGHRKTYIGAMPGRIIDAVIKSGSMNPIILLDEIDKIGNDIKGDPSSALLEALDPEQNNTFADHYIEFPVDLSKVLFITTANDTSTIAPPLFDRMEVIELGSYTATEKFRIAKDHLVKKEMTKHALCAREFKVTDGALEEIIAHYTREAGVRRLEKCIGTLCRKASVALESGAKSFRVNEKNLQDYLGVPKYTDDLIPGENQVGVVNGLAWTSVGGTMLPIEVSAFPGTGKVQITGNLGDVMTESVKTAVGFIRSRADTYGIDDQFYKNKDLHIHAPEAAIPKDGPSAGITMATAMLSAVINRKVKAKVAMTGKQELESVILEIEARIKMMDYVVEYMQNPENEYASIPAFEGIGEKSIALYNQLVLDRERLLLASEKGNPALLLADKQLAEQRKMLLETIAATRNSIKASLNELNKKNHIFNSQLSELPTQEREYIEMKRQQKIKETIYLFLMQKLQEKSLINSPDEQAGRIVDAAYCSAKPVFPKKLIVLAIAFIIACILSLISIYLKVFVFTKR